MNPALLCTGRLTQKETKPAPRWCEAAGGTKGEHDAPEKISPEDPTAFLKKLSVEAMKIFLVHEEVLAANEEIMPSSGLFRHDEASAANFIAETTRFRSRI